MDAKDPFDENQDSEVPVGWEDEESVVNWLNAQEDDGPITDEQVRKVIADLEKERKGQFREWLSSIRQWEIRIGFGLFMAGFCTACFLWVLVGRVSPETIQAIQKEPPLQLVTLVPTSVWLILLFGIGSFFFVGSLFMFPCLRQEAFDAQQLWYVRFLEIAEKAGIKGLSADRMKLLGALCDRQMGDEHEPSESSLMRLLRSVLQRGLARLPWKRK